MTAYTARSLKDDFRRKGEFNVPKITDIISQWLYITLDVFVSTIDGGNYGDQSASDGRH
jgi:hypothetical protein